MIAAMALALAQDVRLEDRGNAVQLTSGYDRAVAPLSVQISRGWTLGDRAAGAGVRWTVPLAAPDLGDQRLAVFGALDLNPEHGWMVRLRPALVGTTTRNDAYRASGVGADLTVLAGASGARWVAGAEITAGSTIAARFSPTAWARSHGGVPSDGAWRFGSSPTLRAGLCVAGTFGPVELGVRGGWDRLGSLTITPPVYALLSAGVRFGG